MVRFNLISLIFAYAKLINLLHHKINISLGIKKVVIFVSGNGSNMQNIINHFKNDDTVKITHVLSNKRDCLALKKAQDCMIDTVFFNKESLENGQVTRLLTEISPSLIVLAGFLLKIPESLVKQFPNKIINVHPALLPKFGGKGMYGKNVHEAVIKAGEKESGITIHYVNENYDEGNIIAQFSCSLSEDETVESLQAKIHQLEQENFPKTIQKLLA